MCVREYMRTLSHYLRSLSINVYAAKKDTCHRWVARGSLLQIPNDSTPDAWLLYWNDKPYSKSALHHVVHYHWMLNQDQYFHFHTEVHIFKKPRQGYE